jgi:hypothetical protein
VSICLDAMAAAAQSTGCTHVKFEQITLIESIAAYTDDNDQGKHGICYGLSVCWLERMKERKDASFFTDLANLDFNNKASPGVALLNRARQVYIMQKDVFKEVAVKSQPLKWQKLVGLEAAEEDGESKTGYYYMDDMEKLTTWFGKSMGTRYFMVHVPKHSMAASGSKLGAVEFFDPNAGVLQATRSSTLAKGLTAYFSTPAIKKAYSDIVFRPFVEKLK